MNYCKTHKANPPMLNCNECFPINETLELASNEEIERRIKEHIEKELPIGRTLGDFHVREAYKRGIRFGLSLASELKAQNTITAHGYTFSIMTDGNLWISANGGEGMGMSKKSLDQFWKDNF